MNVYGATKGCRMPLTFGPGKPVPTGPASPVRPGKPGGPYGSPRLLCQVFAYTHTHIY